MLLPDGCPNYPNEVRGWTAKKNTWQLDQPWVLPLSGKNKQICDERANQYNGWCKIKDAQKKALIKTFVKKNIPFREFKVKKINEEILGELFSFFIVETIIVGKLLNLNPFNQPAVEQVKVHTKNYLLKSTK